MLTSADSTYFIRNGNLETHLYYDLTSSNERCTISYVFGSVESTLQGFVGGIYIKCLTVLARRSYHLGCHSPKFVHPQTRRAHVRSNRLLGRLTLRVLRWLVRITKLPTLLRRREILIRRRNRFDLRFGDRRLLGNEHWLLLLFLLFWLCFFLFALLLRRLNKLIFTSETEGSRAMSTPKRMFLLF